MRKNLIISIIFVLFFIISGCGGEEDCRLATERKDGYKCDEISGFWEKLKDGEDNNGSLDSECLPGSFQCVGNESYYCTSLNNEWVYDARCENGCNEATGKCNESGNDTDTDTDTTDTTDTTEEPTNPTEEPTGGCKLDESLLDSDAKAYFAFKGAGVINDPGTEDPEWASLVKTSLVGIDGKDLDYATSYSFFLTTTLTANDGSDINSVALEALGDPDMSTGRFTTIAFAALPIDYIEMLKELVDDPDYMESYPEYAEKHIVPIAPVTQIIDILYTADTHYVKQCMLAVNKYGNNEVFGQETSIGKFQVCYEKNEDFSIGETFKLAMNAELAMGQEIVDMYTDVDSIDDLCTCFDLKATGDDDQVDCATIDWEGGDVEVICKETDHKQLNEAEDGCECMTGYHADGDNCVEDEAPAVTCDAEAHKTLNEAQDGCVCMLGYHADGDNCVEDAEPECTTNEQCDEGEVCNEGVCEVE